MDMNNHDVQPQELARAQKSWENFAKASRIVCAVTAVTLILMAVFLL